MTIEKTTSHWGRSKLLSKFHNFRYNFDYCLNLNFSNTTPPYAAVHVCLLYMYMSHLTEHLHLSKKKIKKVIIAPCIVSLGGLWFHNRIEHQEVGTPLTSQQHYTTVPNLLLWRSQLQTFLNSWGFDLMANILIMYFFKKEIEQIWT